MHPVLHVINLLERPKRMTCDVNILVLILIEAYALPNNLPKFIHIFAKVLKSTVAEKVIELAADEGMKEAIKARMLSLIGTTRDGHLIAWNITRLIV